MTDFTTEISSLHDVKVAICFILYKLNRPVTEEQLYEISVNSEVINYFLYAEALYELIQIGSITKKQDNGKTYLVLEDKGRAGSEYFSSYIPFFFRKRVLKAAYSFFAKLDRERATDINIKPTSNGCEVCCAIKDAHYDLLRFQIYAPDNETAEMLKSKILLNPERLYKKMIEAVLTNEEEELPPIDQE